MKNIELLRILSQMPPELDVVVFRTGNTTLKDITRVCIGNEKYLPGSKNKNSVDKIVIDYTKS